jgi:hypothetical protein
VLAAYVLPAIAVWAVLGLAVTVVRLAWLALAAAAAYGGYYAVTEISGRRGLPPPGRSWQVPQSMMIEAPVRTRLLVWGALLGPGFATRNPYAGFWLLPLAVASMPGPGAGLAVGAAVGLAHGAARAGALLRDVRDLRPDRQPDDALTGHLDLLLKTVYWRRLDGALLAAAAAIAFAAWLRNLT